MKWVASGKPRVYIASPYTLGDVAVNVKNQLDAFDALLDIGCIPFAPLMSHFNHMAHPRPYSTWLELDREWITVCDCVLRLPGESSGADEEVKLAAELGIPVFGGDGKPKELDKTTQSESEG